MKQNGKIVLPEKQTCPRRLWIAPKHNKIDVRKRTQNANIPHLFRVKEDEAGIHKCERGQKSTEHKKSLRWETICKLFCFLLEINSVSLDVLSNLHNKMRRNFRLTHLIRVFLYMIWDCEVLFIWSTQITKVSTYCSCALIARTWQSQDCHISCHTLFFTQVFDKLHLSVAL